MSRILMSGFETPSSPVEEGWEQFDTTNPDTEASSWQSGGRTIFDREQEYGRLLGGQRYCLTFDSNDGLTGAFGKAVPATTEAWGRFAWAKLSSSRTANGRICEWYLDGIGTICSITEYDIGQTNVSLYLRSNSGTVLAFAPQVGLLSPFSVWYLFEWHLRLAGSNGLLEVWVNGTKFLSYLGPLAGPGGEVVFDRFVIGQGNPGPGQSYNTNSRSGYDDIAINNLSGLVNNGRVGNGIIFARRPLGPGFSTQLLNDLGAADPAINYRRVNRVNDPVGFVGAVTAAGKDSYALSEAPQTLGGGEAYVRGMPIQNGSVSAMLLGARAIRNGPAISNLRYTLTPDGQAEAQVPTAPGLPISASELTTLNHIVDGNPNTGDAFSHDEMLGAEAGFSLEA